MFQTTPAAAGVEGATVTFPLSPGQVKSLASVLELSLSSCRTWGKILSEKHSFHYCSITTDHFADKYENNDMSIGDSIFLQNIFKTCQLSLSTPDERSMYLYILVCPSQG